MCIFLKEIWSVEESERYNYKLHLAQSANNYQPLDVYTQEGFDGWQNWQVHRGDVNRFNRNYIFSLMQFYPEGDDIWLFGGIFEVLGENQDGYVVEITDVLANFIGRMKIRLIKDRTNYPNLETYYDRMVVWEILKTEYLIPKFPGYDKIDISFRKLEHVIRHRDDEWRSPLQNVYGIYMITDTSTRLRYVGSAYGEGGIWARWEQYVQNGHGGNTRMIELIDPDLIYPRDNFRFTVLEYFGKGKTIEAVIEREEFWKQVLLSKGEFGLNL